MAGKFCISIDLELAWGVWDRLTDEYISRCSTLEREIVHRLLDRFHHHDIEATWAIVGHLLSERESTARGGKEVWYAPDLIDAIRSAKKPQEIGSHSYAHIYFAGTDEQEARKDLAEARRIHDENGLPFESFVFPRNQVGHASLLASEGVRVYRSDDRGWYVRVGRANRLAGRVANLIDKVLPIPPSTVVPVRHPNGLVEIESSMLLMSRSGPRRLISPKVLSTKARLGLQAAARKGEVFHLWFHPLNFYYEMDTQFEVLERILETATAMRARGDIEIVPMRAFAA